MKIKILPVNPESQNPRQGLVWPPLLAYEVAA